MEGHDIDFYRPAIRQDVMEGHDIDFYRPVIRQFGHRQVVEKVLDINGARAG